jgi:hypothetical protein
MPHRTARAVHVRLCGQVIFFFHLFLHLRASGEEKGEKKKLFGLHPVSVRFGPTETDSDFESVRFVFPSPLSLWKEDVRKVFFLVTVVYYESRK